jgi:phenylalanine-4-hydroxylase
MTSDLTILIFLSVELGLVDVGVKLIYGASLLNSSVKNLYYTAKKSNDNNERR